MLKTFLPAAAIAVATLGVAPAAADQTEMIDHGVKVARVGQSIPLPCETTSQTSVTAPGDIRNGDTSYERFTSTTVSAGGREMAREPSSADEDGNLKCVAKSFKITEPGRYDVSTLKSESRMRARCDNDPETHVCRPPHSIYNYATWEDEPGYPKSRIESTTYVVPECAAVISQSGQVTSGNRELALGDGVDKGSMVQTGDDGRVEVGMSDGSVVRLGPRSKVRIDSCDTPAGHGWKFNLRLVLGSIWAKVTKHVEGRTFEVQTDRVVVGVRGTQFSVSDDGKKTTVRVTEGSVRVRNRKGKVKRTVVVKAGRTAVAGNAGPPKLVK